MWSVPRFSTATAKDATRFPAGSNLRMFPVQSAWPTYMFPAASKAMDEGLQLYPLPKVPGRRLPLASNRSTRLPGVGFDQWGTYMFPAASNATLLACAVEVPVKVCRNDPSGLYHCTRPSFANAKNTSPPVGGGPFETVTVMGADVPVLLAASRATAGRVWDPLLVG